jgi:hypothetical protein
VVQPSDEIYHSYKLGMFLAMGEELFNMKAGIERWLA